MFRTALRYTTTLLIGLIAAFLMWDGVQEFRVQWYLLTPSSEIYSAELSIPDYKFGTDPTITFSRMVGSTVNVTATSEMKQIGTTATVCHKYNSTHVDYGEPQSTTPMTLERYMNDNCKDVGVGEYYVETYITVEREGFPDRFVTIRSNDFKITP